MLINLNGFSRWHLGCFLGASHDFCFAQFVPVMYLMCMAFSVMMILTYDNWQKGVLFWHKHMKWRLKVRIKTYMYQASTGCNCKKITCILNYLKSVDNGRQATLILIPREIHVGNPLHDANGSCHKLLIKHGNHIKVINLIILVQT